MWLKCQGMVQADSIKYVSCKHCHSPQPSHCSFRSMLSPMALLTIPFRFDPCLRPETPTEKASTLPMSEGHCLEWSQTSCPSLSQVWWKSRTVQAIPPDCMGEYLLISCLTNSLVPPALGPVSIQILPFPCPLLFLLVQ